MLHHLLRIIGYCIVGYFGKDLPQSTFLGILIGAFILDCAESITTIIHEREYNHD